MRRILLLLGIIALFFTSCTSVDTIDIVDLQREPASYANQDIAVAGRASKEIAPEGSASRFNYFIKDYSGQKIRIDCYNNEFAHNQKYIVNAKFIYNNNTRQYYLRCIGTPKKAGGLY